LKISAKKTGGKQPHGRGILPKRNSGSPGKGGPRSGESEGIPSTKKKKKTMGCPRPCNLGLRKKKKKARRRAQKTGKKSTRSGKSGGDGYVHAWCRNILKTARIALGGGKRSITQTTGITKKSVIKKEVHAPVQEKHGANIVLG